MRIVLLLISIMCFLASLRKKNAKYVPLGCLFIVLAGMI